jgi:hypothetical protein
MVSGTSFISKKIKEQGFLRKFHQKTYPLDLYSRIVSGIETVRYRYWWQQKITGDIQYFMTVFGSFYSLPWLAECVIDGIRHHVVDEDEHLGKRQDNVHNHSEKIDTI